MIDRNQEGFTLIELLLVIAIIGILAAIAIPQFSNYRKRAFDAAAQYNLRNAATAQEAYYADESTYCSTTSTLTGATYGLYLSDKVVFTIASANASTYVMEAYHPLGRNDYIIRGPGGSVSEK